MRSGKVKQVSGDTNAKKLNVTSAECRSTAPSSLAMMQASNVAGERQTTTTRAQYPGAVAVRGMCDASTVSADSNDEHLMTTMTSTTTSPGQDPTSPNNNIRPITARLVSVSQDVSPQELERLRRDQMELERMRRERENAAVAVVIQNHDNEDENLRSDVEQGDSQDSTGHSKPRPCTTWCKCSTFKWIVACIVGVVAVGAVLGGVFSSLTSNDEPPPKDLNELLSSVSLDGGVALATPSTPQNMAYEWLKGNTNLNSFSDQKKIQRYVLATLYYANGGDEWFNNTGWMTDADECEWFSRADRAVCTNDGAILELDVRHNNLIGKIPNEIALLSNSLDELSLGGNRLTGTIPSELGLLTNCPWMSASNNRLTGSIPSELGLATTLHSLRLYNNTLSGPIPSELGLLTDLTILYLNNNTLSGTIPSEMDHLTKLTRFFVYSNDFSGDYTCPDYIPQCYVSCNDRPNEDRSSTCRSL